MPGPANPESPGPCPCPPFSPFFRFLTCSGLFYVVYFFQLLFGPSDPPFLYQLSPRVHLCVFWVSQVLS